MHALGDGYGVSQAGESPPPERHPRRGGRNKTGRKHAEGEEEARGKEGRIVEENEAVCKKGGYGE